MPPAKSQASKKRKACDATQLNVATKAAQVIDVLIPNEVCKPFSNNLGAAIASQPPQTPTEVPLHSILCLAVLP